MEILLFIPSRSRLFLRPVLISGVMLEFILLELISYVFLTVVNSNINKEPHGVVSGQAQHLEDAALLSDQSKNPGQEITIKVFPSSQGISLVTGNILSTDVGAFSTQVPAILTEGDAEDSETHYQVNTTKVQKQEIIHHWVRYLAVDQRL